jgi:hypothetical protein
MRSSSLRRLFGATLTTLALATAACGGDSDSTGPSAPSSPPADVSGSYSLIQVRTLGNLGGGGSGLPVDFVDGSGDHLVFISGTLVLTADNRFDLSVEATFKGSPVTMTDYGSYSANGASIDFDSEKSSPRLSTGTLSGAKLTAQSQFGNIPFEIDLQK